MVESSDEVVHSTETASQNYTKSGTSTLQRSELSLDINDILALDLKETPTEPQHSGKSAKPEKIKCCPTLIGCGDLSPGCNTYTSPRSCANLHCRDCDFPVISFPSSEWTERVDYLYLRTNMPNLEKMSEKLRTKADAVAYACHCVSISTEKLQPLHETGRKTSAIKLLSKPGDDEWMEVLKSQICRPFCSQQTVRGKHQSLLICEFHREQPLSSKTFAIPCLSTLIDNVYISD